MGFQHSRGAYRRDRFVAKLQGRAQRWNPALAFVVTLVEAVLTLLLVRFVWRCVKRGGMWMRRHRPVSAG